MMLSLSSEVMWLGGIAVTLFGLWLTHKFTVWRERAKRRVEASSAFRSVFLTKLSGLYPEPVKWPENPDYFLRGIFPELQAAVAQFRPFVPWWKRKAFDKAWFEYRCSTGRKIDIQCYHHYMGFSDMPDPKETLRANVNRLLGLTKET
jgi:hypothetical protein